MRTVGDNADPAVVWRLARVLAVVVGLAAAVTVAVATGAITLPGGGGRNQVAQASARTSLAASRLAADKQWASTTCTNVLDWKNEIARDGTSLDLGFGPAARVQDAITATTRLVSQLDKLGLPPGAGTGQARAELNQLRSDIESRLRNLEGTAGSVDGGNLAAIATLIGTLENDKVLGTQVIGELRRVVSVDLGLSLAETRACRQLVGIPI